MFSLTYTALGAHEKQQFLDAAANPILRQSLEKELCIIENELLHMTMPAELTTASSIQFALAYNELVTRKKWLEDFLRTLNMCVEEHTYQNAVSSGITSESSPSSYQDILSKVLDT